MRALVQRVNRCAVRVDGRILSEIGPGILVLIGVAKSDRLEDAVALAKRCVDLRIFDDGNGKMNRSLRETEGAALAVSQFTLYGDTRKGNRPSYSDAASASDAERLYEAFVATLRQEVGEGKVATGMFRAMMSVELVNDGPVTLLLESKPG